VVAGADSGCGIHACGWGPHPCMLQVTLIRVSAGRRDAMIFIYLLKKSIIAMGLRKTTDLLLLCFTAATCYYVTTVAT
jgi:hypothetical protein